MRMLRNQSGAAAIELAMLLIPLVFLAFGITEYGRAVYQYNTIAKNVRDAARYLSFYAPGDSARIDEAKNLAVCGTTDACGTPLVPNLTPDDVTVQDRSSNKSTHGLQQTGKGTVNLVTVTVSGFTFQSLVTYVMPDTTFGPITATFVQTL